MLRFIISCLVGLGLISQYAFAEGLGPPPIVLILLDTSGSMQYTPEGKSTEVGDNQAELMTQCYLNYTQKSRFIVALELLMGQYQNYSCTYDDRSQPPNREDKGYIPMHVVPQGVPSGTGLIPLAQGRIKFGLMATDTEKIPGQGLGGGYSYGDEGKPNYGARNKQAPWGYLVVPSSSDEENAILETNNQVWLSASSSKPYGETPLAAMLYDALYFFEHEPSVQPYNPQTNTGDMYADCRDKHVLLITDGRANLAEGTDNYNTSVFYASRLKEKGIKVTVVGFNLAVGVPSLLYQIASAGGTSNPEIINPSNLEPLIAKLLTRFQPTQETWDSIQSRTRVVVTDDTGRARATSQSQLENIPDMQYQFQCAYSLVKDIPGLRQGFLERQIYQCTCGLVQSSDTAIFCKTDSLSDRLNQTVDSGRNIFTIVDGKIEAFSTSNTKLTPDVMNIPNQGTLPEIKISTPSPSTCVGGVLGEASNQATRQEYARRVIKYIRGSEDTCRAHYKTGAIIHSTPAIQTRLSEEFVHLPSAKNFAVAIKDRPTMLYVGTHDGLLHAFRVDKTGDQLKDAQQWGREMWSILPNHLLKKVWKLPTNFTPLFDGSIKVKDILLYRTQETLASPSVESQYWKTVLVGGYREGGRGYIALDVTDPMNPKFLWEISNEGRWVGGQNPMKDPTCGGGEASDCNDFSRLGYSFSVPELGIINRKVGENSFEQIAVAVFGGGSSNNLSGDPLIGKTVFVVRLDNGAKIWESNTQNPNVDADLLGDVSCYSTALGNFISKCYLGDRKGRLWRVELAWDQTKALSMILDPYPPPSGIPFNPILQRSPVYEAPALATTHIPNQLVVVYGGGDSDDPLDRDKLGFITSVTEMPDPDNPQKWKVTQNWIKYFTSSYGGEKMMGPPIIFGGSALCITFLPNPFDGCSAGYGTLWGFDYYNSTKVGASPIGTLDADGDPNTIDKTDHIGLGSGVFFGAEVVNRPQCFSGQGADAIGGVGVGAAKLGAIGRMAPKIIVQRSRQGQQNENQVPQEGGNVPQVPTKEVSNFSGFPPTMFSTSWGFIFD